MDLAPLRIMVTGGSGFLGAPVCQALQERGCRQVFVPRSAEYDLRTVEGVRAALAAARPQLVFHLAGPCGGSGARVAQPGRFFHEHAVMGLHLMDECRRAGVAKLIVAGSASAYPKFAPVPCRETDLWNGPPDETTSACATAKKMLLVQGEAYRQQYGFPSVHLLTANLYGPKDRFDPETAAVVPALIRKFSDAVARRHDRVVLWGDGTATRDFLHVRDAARAFVLAAEQYDGAEPVNVGSGLEVRVRYLAVLVQQLTGYTGAVDWDASRPSGPPRRCLDTSRAERLLGFRAQVPLAEGLRETVEWYRRTLEVAAPRVQAFGAALRPAA